MYRLVRLNLIGLLVGITLIATGLHAHAIVVGQIDNFENGSVAGWGSGIPGFTITEVVADAGPLGVGDDALNVEATVKIVVHNTTTRWTGNYTLAGVTKISMDIQQSNGFPLNLWLAISNGPFFSGGGGDTYVTAQSAVVPSDGQWHRISFDVLPEDFIPTVANSTEPPDAIAALQNVTYMRLLHSNAPGQFVGDFQSGSFRLDNIMAEGAAPSEDADFDDDGDVDGRDLLVWQRNLGVGTQHNQGDADLDGVVGGDDLIVWREQFGPAATPVASIPEPSAAALAVASLLMLRRRR